MSFVAPIQNRRSLLVIYGRCFHIFSVLLLNEIVCWHKLYLWNEASGSFLTTTHEIPKCCCSPDNDGVSSDNNVLCPTLVFTKRPSSTEGNLTSGIRFLPIRHHWLGRGHVGTGESLCVRLTWCSRRHRGSRPCRAVAASSRDLVDVLALQRRHQGRLSNMVGVTQTQLVNKVIVHKK